LGNAHTVAANRLQPSHDPWASEQHDMEAARTADYKNPAVAASRVAARQHIPKRLTIADRNELISGPKTLAAGAAVMRMRYLIVRPGRTHGIQAPIDCGG